MVEWMEEFMLKRRTRWIAPLVLTALLAGCGSPLTTASKYAPPSSKLSAKSMSDVEILAEVNKANAVAPVLVAALPAIFAAPTDYAAQQYMQNANVQGVSQSLEKLSSDVDEALSEYYISEYEKTYAPLPQTDPLVQYLQGISDRVTKASGTAPFKIHVVNDPSVNAFNAGGHAMVIFKGFLAAAEDEAEIAGVMAHEMVHGERRHSMRGLFSRLAGAEVKAAVEKRAPASKKDEELVTAYWLSLGDEHKENYDQILSFLQGKVGTGMMKRVRFQGNTEMARFAISQQNEVEADQGALRKAAKAGYDPYGLVRFLDRLNNRPEKDTRFYSHPAVGSRVGAARYQIEREGLAEQGKERGAERYAAIKSKADNMVASFVKPKVPSKLSAFVSNDFCF